MKSGHFSMVTVSTTKMPLLSSKTRAEILLSRPNPMKKLLALVALSVAIPSVPVQAYESNPGSARQCFRYQYREEYIPGNADRKGRVKSWTEQVEVPCSPRCSRPRRDRTSRPRHRPQTRPMPSHVDDNSCIEGSILGGLAGGAAGAALSQDEGMIYGIPLGIIGGVLVGCQIDGG